MTFDEIYAPIYRRIFEFHKRHSGAKTEDDFEKIALDETSHCAKNPEFAAALFWVVVDEIKRGKSDG